MSFRGFLRPGQGFKPFTVLRRTGGMTATGRPQTKKLEPIGEIWGIVTQTSPSETEQWKQKGHPVTHTIVQRGTEVGVKPNDILELREPGMETRCFTVRVRPKDPAMLDHFTVYKVKERTDLQ